MVKFLKPVDDGKLIVEYVLKNCLRSSMRLRNLTCKKSMMIHLMMVQMIQI